MQTTATAPIQGRLIWKCPMPFNYEQVPVVGTIRIEFPHLIRFREAWYCGFREAAIHENHPSGQGRIISSADGIRWRTIKLLNWQGADAGTPRFSITAEGRLLVVSTLNFVSAQPRDDGFYYQLERERLGLGLTPYSADEQNVACQSVSWLSADGTSWEGAYACPESANTNRFNVTWHAGMGYSLTNALGASRSGALHRTRDGINWRPLLRDFVPADQGDEADLAFLPDGSACCLLRGDNRSVAMIGTASGPYYQNWHWITPMVDWRAGGPEPIQEVFRVQLGGPRMISLRDGRLVGAGRTLPPERPDGPWRIDPGDPQGKEDGRIVVFWVDPSRRVLGRLAEIDGTSYPGLVEHEGELWVTYVVHWGENPGIYLAKIKIPPLDRKTDGGTATNKL